MTIVETSVWIDLLQGRANAQIHWLRSNRRSPDLTLTDLILCEVLQGIGPDSVYEAIRVDLMSYGVHATCGSDLATEAAQNYRTLRKRGITIRNAVDCITATYCIREGHSLLHHDRDFDPFEEHLGLRVIRP